MFRGNTRGPPFQGRGGREREIGREKGWEGGQKGGGGGWCG